MSIPRKQSRSSLISKSTAHDIPMTVACRPSQKTAGISSSNTLCQRSQGSIYDLIQRALLNFLEQFTRSSSPFIPDATSSAFWIVLGKNYQGQKASLLTPAPLKRIRLAPIRSQLRAACRRRKIIGPGIENDPRIYTIFLRWNFLDASRNQCRMQVKLNCYSIRWLPTFAYRRIALEPVDYALLDTLVELVDTNLS